MGHDVPAQARGCEFCAIAHALLVRIAPNRVDKNIQKVQEFSYHSKHHEEQRQIVHARTETKRTVDRGTSMSPQRTSATRDFYTFAAMPFSAEEDVPPASSSRASYNNFVKLLTLLSSKMRAKMSSIL